jgi:coenzyme Q-binding protein COQ10
LEQLLEGRLAFFCAQARRVCKMITRRETRTVEYPAALMYAVVSDVENYPKFLPWVVALRVLSRHQDGLIAEMAIGYGALRERYTSNVTLDPQNHRIDVVQTDGPFKILENHWRFTPKGAGCEVEFSIQFEFKSRLLHSVAGHAFEKVMLKMADAFEARASDLVEAGKQQVKGP